MASDRRQNEPRHQTRAKKKVITSCVECYRRKQKCDRVQPCNFCSARGVPELCRYGVIMRKSASRGEQVLSQLDSSADSHASVVSSPPVGLIDQIGYSSASRRIDLEAVGEHPSETVMSNFSSETFVTVANVVAYLDLVTRLPSEQVTAILIDDHFSTASWAFPVLDEHHFRNLHSQFQSRIGCLSSSEGTMQLPAILATFPALLLSVLAITLQFVSPDTEEAHALKLSTTLQCVQLSQRYFDTGQQIIRLFKRHKPTTASIEYYLLEMVWLKNCGRGREAWQSLGMAIRQAQEIDLHQVEDYAMHVSDTDIGNTLAQMWDIEHKKRLWARIFIIDSHMAVALGRPRGIHREDCTTCAPLDCDFPRKPSQTVPVSTRHTQQPPNAFSSTMFSIALAHKYHDLMSLRGSQLDLRDYSKVTALHNEVEGMLTELPPALRPSFPDAKWDEQQSHLTIVRLRIRFTANTFLLALHRPYVSTHATSRNAVIGAALTILQTQRTLFEILPQAQHKLYGYSFYTIDAGILLTTVISKYPTLHTDSSFLALYELQHACTRLSCMKERSLIAGTGEVVLRKCCGLIETSFSSPMSMTSNDSVTDASSGPDLTTTYLLQELGYNTLDEAIRELMPPQSEPSSAFENSRTNTTTLSASESSNQDINVPTLDQSLGNNFTYSDLMTDGVDEWPFQ